MIQMWAVNTKIVSSDVQILNNVFNSGDGVASQTIFLGNELGKNNPDFHYQNITISGNVIYNGHLAGIRVSAAEGVHIENNTLLWNEKATIGTHNSVPTIKLVEVTDATVINNITSSVTDGPGITASGNRLIDYNDASSPNYFGKHFVNVNGFGETDLRDLSLLPDSPWLGSGSPMSQPDVAIGPDLAVIVAQQTEADIWEWSFDAGLSTVDGDGLRYVWDFSDGIRMEGEVVTRGFGEAGPVGVKLSILDQGSVVADLERGFEIENRDFVEFDFGAAGLDDLADEGAGFYSWAKEE